MVFQLPNEQSNVALARLAHATANKGYSPAVSLQALVGLRHKLQIFVPTASALLASVFNGCLNDVVEKRVVFL